MKAAPSLRILQPLSLAGIRLTEDFSKPRYVGGLTGAMLEVDPAPAGCGR